MQEIQTPIRIPELDIKGDPESPPTLIEKVQNTLSILTGYWKHKRVLLKASPSGILFATNPAVEEFYHVTGSGANDDYQGNTKDATEVLVIAHPDNAGRIWVNKGKVATDANGIPLDAKESTRITVTNLNQLHIKIVTDGEKAIVGYSI
jgi:hypothetical protein